MGGAIAVHYADRCTVELISRQIVGMIVIDVVEGTAKEALSQMQQVLRSRPTGFKSIEYAIEWYLTLFFTVDLCFNMIFSSHICLPTFCKLK